MAQLQQTRKGWENEHLATYLLSRISFLAHPITVSDDVGVDLVCTLFVPEMKNGCMQLFPRQAFAIQIKSSEGDVPAKDRLAYYRGLELPFFLGVVNRSSNSLKIFSGELLPDFFASVRSKCSLTLVPQKAPIDHKPTGAWEKKGKRYRVPLPLIAELRAKQWDKKFDEARKTLLARCDFILRNIATSISREYVFRYPFGKKDYYRIIADSESIKTFRLNLVLRLTEAFFNLREIFNERRYAFRLSEFTQLEVCYHAIKSLDYPLKEIKLLDALYGDLQRAVSKARTRPPRRR